MRRVANRPVSQLSAKANRIGYFVLDNATNNNTTLVELGKVLGFKPKDRRLRYIGHVINLILEAYLFG